MSSAHVGTHYTDIIETIHSIMILGSHWKGFGTFIYVWLCWVFAVVWAFSSCDDQGQLQLGAGGQGFSFCCLLLFPSSGSRACVGLVSAPGLGGPVTPVVLPGQGSNSVPLELAGGLSSLDHQGSPPLKILTLVCTYWHFNHIPPVQYCLAYILLGERTCVM